ncbi:MAG TPA: putative toxin-antitoxin system toxin component, PIN family [Longimicrobiaceae bacterium]|nr:putative toxin-antitoxin system toxin component, PIN family [Longimicrobiaceae bacterium]
MALTAPQIVLDTNILVAGLLSNRGPAFEILTLVGTGKFSINLSVPLVLEYEEVLTRSHLKLQVSREDVESVLDFHCEIGRRHEIYFLWRPFLPDDEDDLVVELAVKAGCQFIVTYNTRDFAGCHMFGIEVVTPHEFLQRIGVRQ